MYHPREANPHFLPQHNNDPVIEFPSQTPPPRSRLPPQTHSRTSVEPPHGPRPQSPTQHPLKPLPPPQTHQESRPPHFASEPLGAHPPSQHGRHHLRAPTHRRTRPIAWLVAACCALFWVTIIVGGLIVLIIYLVFRPRSPRFDISTVTFNAAYLDVGYLLTADITVLVNFSNPNSKVNVDFSYIVLDLYFERKFITTRYIEPFSVMRSESRFADVDMVASQLRLSMGHSMELQKQMDDGRVYFEIKGLFRTRSSLGGVLQYSYWLNAHCRIVVTSPPAGVLIGKKCVTKR